MKIDFVVAWVDGNDPEWNKKKSQYQTKIADSKAQDSSNSRYRDWGIFKYWFRSVMINAPWVNKVYLVTDRQIPQFINRECEKLQIIFHEDYIPKEYLPTFSSHTIELNFHRIPDLSEHFVYFNDDMYLNQPVKEDDFFRSGMPCYDLIERPLVPRANMSLINYICINDMGVINEHFSRKDLVKHFFKFVNYRYGKHSLKNLFLLPQHNIQHFADNHMPCPFLKSTLEEVWEKEESVLSRTCLNRFRTFRDVNQYVFKYWDQARGNFHPYYFEGGYYSIDSSNIMSCIEDILNSRHLMMCINDKGQENDFFENAKRLQSAFEQRYPEECCFEQS